MRTVTELADRTRSVAHEEVTWSQSISYDPPARLLNAFAAIALTLGGLGVYAVLAHAVARRTREIGIRAALGASRRDLTRLVLGQATLLLLVGLVVGLGGATAMARGLRTMLFGLTPTDPVTYVAVAVLVSAVVAFGVLIPLRGAARVDPIQALRE